MTFQHNKPNHWQFGVGSMFAATTAVALVIVIASVVPPHFSTIAMHVTSVVLASLLSSVVAFARFSGSDKTIFAGSSGCFAANLVMWVAAAIHQGVSPVPCWGCRPTLTLVEKVILYGLPSLAVGAAIGFVTWHVMRWKQRQTPVQNIHDQSTN